MKTSTFNEPNDREAPKTATRPPANEGKIETAIRCRLCRETFVLATNFRLTAATCPHCGLKFVFDPQQEPLPVRGLRLHHSAVLDAEQRPGAVRRRRHDAHVRPTLQVRPPQRNFLAWAGGLALSAAAATVFFGAWFHRLLGR